MWHRSIAFAAVTLALAGCGMSLPGAVDRASAPVISDADNPLQFVSAQTLTPRLTELTLTTPAMGGETKVRVLLPADYAASGQRYPVVYLYNGSFDDQAAWTTKGDAEHLTEGAAAIFVMPDGGAGGYYTDWYNFGAFGPPAWETYHVKQLVPWIDAHYRTVAARGGRATLGLSMGGFGAFAYAARHPDLLGIAVSFSGALNTNEPADTGQPDESALDLGVPFSTWGVRATDEVRWRGQNPWDLAGNLRGIDLTMRTGNGLPGDGYSSVDPIEILIHLESTDMHEKLTELGIPHLWDDYGAGGHSWDYWQNDFIESLPLIMQRFAAPLPAPSPFSFTAIEADYSVYGWQVHLTRPALEFSTLGNADAGGFTLSGSGDAVVTTAALYAPGSSHGVTLQSGEAVQTQQLVADAQGRLAVPVTLGPGNPYQQYTPQARVAGTQVYTVQVTVQP